MAWQGVVLIGVPCGDLPYCGGSAEQMDVKQNMVCLLLACSLATPARIPGPWNSYVKRMQVTA